MTNTKKHRRRFSLDSLEGIRLGDHPTPAEAPTPMEAVENIFCPTGPGGGINPTCGKGGPGSPAVRGASTSPTVLKVGPFEVSTPTSMQGILKALAAYQNSSPADKERILQHLGLPYAKGAPLPSIDQFNTLVTTATVQRLNPTPIADRLTAKAPSEGLRQGIEKLGEKADTLRRRHEELGQQTAALTAQETRLRAAGDKAGADKVRAEGDALSRERYGLKKQIDAVNGEAHTLVKDYLKERAQALGVEPVKVDKAHFPDPQGLTPGHALVGEVAKARAFLDGIVVPSKTGSGPDAPTVPVPGVKVLPAPDGRSGHSNGTLTLGRNTEARSAVHEYGHHLEYKLPGAKEAAQEFLMHRVKGEPETNLGEKYPDRFGKDELGRKDDFDRVYDGPHAYYVGKTYPGGSTEVVSMGVEKLYSDPVRMAKADPEYFHLVLGILSGDARSRPIPMTD